MIKDGDLLKEIIVSVKSNLEKISDEDAAVRPSENKWSKKEILGHLIDSVANNHQRFVRANFKNDLIFNGYEQEKWVHLQGYLQADWNEMINLWYYFNLQLANVIDRIPAEIKHKRHLKHNLNKIAWKTIPADQAASLDYFIKDYIGHLENHLVQIFPDYQPRIIGNY